MKSLAHLVHGLALAILVALVTSPQLAAAAGPKEFFRPQAKAATAQVPKKIPGIASEAHPIEFNAADMLSLQPGEEVSLRLPGREARTVVFESMQSHGGAIHSWVGFYKERGRNNRVIITTGPAGSYGSIDSPEGTFRIVPGPEGQDLLVPAGFEELFPQKPWTNDIRIPPAESKSSSLGQPSFVLAEPGVFSVPAPKATPSLVRVDLMFVVTTGLANKLGAGLMTRLYFLITRANTTYADSEVGIILRFVKLSIVNYPDTGDDGDALNAITPTGGGGTGVFANVEAERIAAGADLVAMLRDGSSFGGSGVAWLGNLSANATFMYSVTTGCVQGCESVFIHEVGHNMGNKHDRYTAAFQNSGLTGGAFPAYSFGYVYCQGGTLTCNPNIANGTPGTCTSGQPECSVTSNSNFRTIMAYFQASTQQLYRFSNPAQTNCATSNGDAVQRACGVNSAAADGADTVQSMNSNRANLSGIKTQVSADQMPGSLQFTALTFSGSESGGTLTFTVSRMRDATIVGGGGTASVNWALTAGSATAGVDYTVANGTLNWADNDFANKTFNVTLANDGVTEGLETFTATLSTPTGAPGVFLGYPTTATGIILEPWPVGALAGIPTDPTGWSSPSDANVSSVAWGIVNGNAPAGDPDGRSVQSGAINFAGATNCNDASFGAIPCPSVVQLTRNFSAGTVAYAYRVSAFPGFGFLEFLVDGVVVQSVSGSSANASADTGWQSFSAPITAGNHTLTWRYRTRLPFACAGASSGGPPPHPSCSDRAWIDQLALPPNTAFADPPRLVNIATRMQVLTGDDVMIGGFIIGGSASKTVVVRARGPSLAAQGVPGTLANPQLQLFSGPTVIGSNDNWQTASNQAAIQAAGFHPSNANESAIMMTLAPGPYTAIVSGVGNTTGVAIIEVFEVDGQTIPLINIATRGRVQTGDNVMIGGFIIQGSGPQTVVVRARGPSLVAQGVLGVLPNPNLQLFNGPTEIANNNDWGTALNAAAIQAAGFHPSNPLESAIMMTLNPGAYTAIVSGIAGGTGVAIVEVFTVP